MLARSFNPIMRFSAVFAAVLLLAALYRFSSSRSVEPVWFDALRDPIVMTAAEEEALTRFVAASVRQRARPVEDLPGALTSDRAPRMVFLSVSDGATPAHVFHGSGTGILKAIEQALSQARGLSENGYRPLWIKLDIVQGVSSTESVSFDTPLDFESSLAGIAFERRSAIAFLPEELVAYGLVDSEQKIRPDAVVRYLERRPRQADSFRALQRSGKVKIHRFATASFFSDGESVIRLYRGHRLFPHVSREELVSAAQAGGRYLTRAVDPDGRFVYLYRPTTDDVSEKYNILRHAGTVYAMLELYEVTGNRELLHAAQRAIEYLLQSARPCQTKSGRATCIVEDGYVKLGGNALAAIALARYTSITHDRQHVPILLQLGRWIQAVQTESGEFAIHKQGYPDGDPVDFVSRYYPGEAVLAMLRLYALTGDESWIRTAEKGAHYLINVRDRDVALSELTHDHWLLYALNELYRYEPNPSYLNHALRIADAIVQSQHRNPPYPDWLGSYYSPPRSTPTATRTEGLCAAYSLARDFGEPRAAKALREAIRLNVAFQLQTQFRPESVLYVKDPQRSLGAFHRSLTDFDIRIDYVQHNISGLLCVYHILGG